MVAGNKPHLLTLLHSLRRMIAYLHGAKIIQSRCTYYHWTDMFVAVEAGTGAVKIPFHEKWISGRVKGYCRKGSIGA